MDFFKRYSSIGSQQQQSASEAIQTLADRVETSTLLEDKRAAVRGLKGFSREYREEVGDAALPALLGCLKQDSEDQHLLKAILETLTNLCAREPGKEDSHNVGESTAASGKFSQAILDDPDDVISTFLELLGDADFYVRYYTVQLLGALHMHSGEELQRRVLVSPMGVGRLVDLLSDQRDIIRNEGIQLLIAMTESNADIQKIVAFENAFDYLLNTVNEEGGARGNIVVQDCLQLLHNLLNYNVSNQNFFREASGIQKLPDLLITDPSQTSAARNNPALANMDEEELEWTAQHSRNMLVVLDIIRMLIQPGNSNTESNQLAMQQCGIIPPLLQLALAHEAPSSVRSQALYAIGDVVRANQINQNLFQRILITASAGDEDNGEKSIPEPAIIIVIRLSVGKRPADVPANEYYIVRAAASYLVQAYVGNNPDAQLALAATLKPPGGSTEAGAPEQHQSAGSLVVSVLLDWRTTGQEDVWRVWYASLLFSTIVRDHMECKEQALRVSLGDVSQGEDPQALLNELMSQARQAAQEGADVRVCISLLSLVCVWLTGFPQGVSVFLDESSNLTFLVEQVSGSSGINALVQGVAAFALGLVYQFDTDAETPVTRDQIYPILAKRVGADQLLVRVQRLRDSKEFQYAVGLAAGTHSNAYGGMAAEMFFDNVFADLFKAQYEAFRQAVRLRPHETMMGPSYISHLQQQAGGAMAGYASSVAGTGSTPGTPLMGGAATVSRAASPAITPAALLSSDESLEPMVPKRECDALSAQLADQATLIARLQQELAQATGQSGDASAQLADEQRRRVEAETSRDALSAEIAQLRAQLDQHSNGSEATGSDEARVQELEQQLQALRVESERQQDAWKGEREEMQKKVTNAEKQAVKAAAAVRSTGKKKEQLQASALEALEKSVQEKDERIAALEAECRAHEEKAKGAEQVEELREKVAALEKEQEDLLVYLADQDMQAKEFRAKLRGYGEDIPLSDEEGDGDEDDDEDEE
ncbi:Vesicle-mediated ER to Golgi transport protein [Coemansia sp. RSA 2703]|nr:Vesicle-mediated ER to Golgi transport protein [Coemansia sp. RSA 2703]KAJ2398085.1 Vesicle-mediated ER to Golgi transport protein [Coemansia sp. RSA 2603]